MPWNSISPNGNISVKANEAPMQQNTTYIETTMGIDVVGTNAAGTEDHFWSVDPGLDGHHRFIKTPAFTVGGLPANPLIASPLDAVMWAKTKLAIESTVQQDVQPFYKNEVAATAQIMQLLGIRAMGVFSVTSLVGAQIPQASVVYSHNLFLQTDPTKGIHRDAAAIFTVNFATALPSANYLVLGACIRDSDKQSDELLFNMSAGHGTLTTVKTVNRFKFQTRSDGGNPHDPLQCWFVVFGG